MTTIYTVVWQENEWETTAEYQGAFSSYEEALNYIHERFVNVEEREKDEFSYYCSIASRLGNNKKTLLYGTLSGTWSRNYYIVVIEEDL